MGVTGPQVVAALERVMAGEVVILTGEYESSVGGAGDWPGRSVGLSPREAEVLALITQGPGGAENGFKPDTLRTVDPALLVRRRRRHGCPPRF